MDIPFSTYTKNRKSARGSSEVYEASIKDHEGEEVKIVWPEFKKEYRGDENGAIPSFPFQIYVAQGAAKLCEDSPAFALALMDFLTEPLESSEDTLYGTPCRYHFQIYTKPASNVLACVAHQRREMEWRTRNRAQPAMVTNWARDPILNEIRYRGRIIVVDNDVLQEQGLLLVSFDPAEYEQPHQYPLWHVADEGDIDTVKAVRLWAPSLFLARLAQWWDAAGGNWIQLYLENRNGGAVSPVFYPAMDPLAIHDAEGEEVYELDSTELPAASHTVDADLESPSDSGGAKIVNLFDKNEFFMREEELTGLSIETYDDSFGLPVSSVWNTKHSRQRPSFSLTLYKAFDVLPVHPKALFSCLNKGMISNEAWTLDVISNIPSVEAAFDYHGKSSARRTASRSASLKQCMHMIINKLMSDILPKELLEYIGEILVPPTIPEYSSRSRRPFRNVFLYLDKNWSTGPLTVYCNPISHQRRCNPGDNVLNEIYDDMDDTEYASGVFEDNVLQVSRLRYWHRVADEIHILWSLSSHRLGAVAIDNLPYVSLRIRAVVERCSCSTEPDPPTREFQAYLKLHNSDRPIVIHEVPSMYSHDLWGEALDLVDCETGQAFPPVPYEGERSAPCHDSWAQTPQLGLASKESARQARLGVKPWLLELEPERPEIVDQGPPGDWWRGHRRQDHFTSGKFYELRLKSNVTIEQWTFGDKINIQGPYNLPPMRVVMEEEARFQYVVKKWHRS